MPKQTYIAFDSEKRKTQVKNAFRDVRLLLLKANSALVKRLDDDAGNNASTVEKDRFTRWFGAYDVENVNHVRTRIYTILRQLEKYDTMIWNDPKSNDVAYMEPPFVPAARPPFYPA